MKRTLSLLLIVVMLAGLCSLADAEGFEKPTVNPTLPADWAPFAENVTITVPVYDRSKAGYPAVDDNYWTKWIQSEFGDKWNITVKYVPIPRGDVMTKYNMLIAAKDSPTIMMEYDYPKVSQWASDGAMQTIDLDAFKAVAPTFYQSMVDNNQLGYTDINGETYFVLTERAYYNTTYTFVTMCRMDWLRKVGYDHVPQSYAEYTDAIDKIIAAGLTDIAPLGLGIPTAAYIQNFGYRDVNPDEAEWAMHSSLGTPGFAWEPTRKMLKRLNSEYHKGWYSSEFDLSMNTAGAATDQQQTDFVNGKLFSYGGYMSGNVAWLNAFYENNPEAELAIVSSYQGVEPGVVDVPQFRADNPFGAIVGFSSYATADQLKAAWMLMEWMIQPEVLYVLENGIEGVTYTLDADGLPVVDGAYMGDGMLNHNMNIDMTMLVHAVRKVGTIEQTIAGITPKGIPQDFYQPMVDNYYELKSIADIGNSYSDPVFACSIASESEYSAALLALWQIDYAKLVKCDPAEFDTLYDQLAQEFLDAGYQEIIDERLAAYEDGQCTKLPAGKAK